MSSTLVASSDVAKANSPSTGCRCFRSNSRRFSRLTPSRACIIVSRREWPREKKTHLAVEIEQVESEKMNFDFNVFLLDVLSLSPTELLER